MDTPSTRWLMIYCRDGFTHPPPASATCIRAQIRFLSC
jgi:hypothetical protein